MPTQIYGMTLERDRAVLVEVLETMATRRAASSRKPTPHTAVMIRKMCLILPEADHLAAFSGVRADELHGEAVHQRAPRPQRAQAGHAEYGRGHRSLHQHQPGAVADQAQHRAGEYPG